MSSQGQDKIPNEEQIQQIAEVAKAAKQAQQAANDLKQKASLTTDPTEQDKLLSESKRKEAESHDKSKEARRMASGAWQGAAGGAAWGAAVGAGLGGVIGTLVGTIAMIPTTGLGALIGIPVGLIHGSWVKPDEEGSRKEVTEEEQHRAVIAAVERAEAEERSQGVEATSGEDK